ncbi:MAG: 4Fe-4S binding protein [Vampirovibrionales bacterium]|nr:4Fe-4S binding protein [Vampirovibrionales bacterium]
MTLAAPITTANEAALNSSLAALHNQQWFKLIGGGSLTDAPLLAQLAVVYGAAGCPMVDLSCDVGVIDAVEKAIHHYLPKEQRPALMVSLPLDPDPHFAQLELKVDDCILCGACVPVCPVEALALEPNELLVNNHRCYGCNRCVPVCPTDALILHPLHPNAQALLPALNHPAVSAVEIHTTRADAALWPEFVASFGDALQGKLLSLCFRPSEADPALYVPLIQACYQFTKRYTPQLPLVLQLDGKPMTGSSDPCASLPAIEGAQQFFAVANQSPWLTQAIASQHMIITLSGGINAHTPPLVQQAGLTADIAGGGLGTVARQAVWTHLADSIEALWADEPQRLAAIREAKRLMQPFV